MLLNRLIQQFSRKTSRIYSYQNWQIGAILTTLTLPVFFCTASEAQLSQIVKAKESEAKQYVNSMNKAQQAYYA